MITFDFSELTDFKSDVLKLVNNKYPGKAKKLMNKAGMALKRKVKADYTAKTGKKTGLLRKSLTKGKAYKYGSTWQVRVFNTAPHAHLLEYGHRFRTIKRRGWKFTGLYVKGRHVLGDAAEDFTPEFNRICEQFVDELIADMGKSKLRRMIRGKRR